MRLGAWGRFAAKVIRSNAGKLELPYKLTYVVTKECHSRCANCKIWRQVSRNELSIDEVRRVAGNTPFLSWLTLTGGEPTDREDLPEIAEAFLQSAPSLAIVNFATNGLNPARIAETCRKIAALRPPKLVVTVSVDGPPGTNDRIRGIPGDFESAMETYRAISGIRGLDAYVGMTLYPDNLDQVKEALASIRERIPSFSPRRFHLNMGHASAHLYGNTGVTAPPRGERFAAALDEGRRLRGIPRSPIDLLERRYQLLARDYLKTGKTPVECAALLASCFLAEDGTLYPCSIWSEPLGNVRESGYSLVPLLQSARARQTREKVVQKSCPNCWSPCEAFQSIAANLT